MKKLFRSLILGAGLGLLHPISVFAICSGTTTEFLDDAKVYFVERRPGVTWDSVIVYFYDSKGKSAVEIETRDPWWEKMYKYIQPGQTWLIRKRTCSTDGTAEYQWVKYENEWTK